MADAFLGEIRIFGGNYAPRNWLLCMGGTIDIAQNTTLFSVIGTNFGGDGRTTMGVPDLQGRSPMGHNMGPGLTRRILGQTVGLETAVVNLTQMPNHRHGIKVSNEGADQKTHSNKELLASATQPKGNKLKTFAAYADPAKSPPVHAMNQSMVGNQGSTSPLHENRQPFTAMNFIMCQDGYYPTRS